MAKGQIAKQEIMNKILNLFGENAFLYNDGKEIRINTQENGEDIQIKLTLTAAKTAVVIGEDNALPGEKITQTPDNSANFNFPPSATQASGSVPGVTIQVTEEEKQNVKNMLAALGL